MVDTMQDAAARELRLPLMAKGGSTAYVMIVDSALSHFVNFEVCRLLGLSHLDFEHFERPLLCYLAQTGRCYSGPRFALVALLIVPTTEMNC